MFLKDNDIFLFQGDSITDCNRDRNLPDSLGSGYPIKVAGEFNMKHSKLNVKFYNRGISGDRTSDLMARWNEDCIALNPTVVCVFVGINDTLRRYDRNLPVSPEEFENNYRFILDKTKKLTERIIIIEPFLLPVSKELEKYREDLDPKIAVVRKLALEYNAKFLPLDGLMNAAYIKKSGDWWSFDGIHPSNAGHALITKHLMTLLEE